MIKLRINGKMKIDITFHVPGFGVEKPEIVGLSLRPCQHELLLACRVVIWGAPESGTPSDRDPS